MEGRGRTKQEPESRVTHGAVAECAGATSYWIALGPQAGREAFTLQTVPARDDNSSASNTLAKAAGLARILHEGGRCISNRAHKSINYSVFCDPDPVFSLSCSEFPEGALEILCQSLKLYTKRIESWQRNLILTQRRRRRNRAKRSGGRSRFLRRNTVNKHRPPPLLPIGSTAYSQNWASDDH